MSYEPEPYDTEPSAAAAKANLPGILLIVTAILNVVAALLCLLGAVGVMNLPDQTFEQAIEQQPAENRKNLEDLGWGPEELRHIYVACCGIPGVLGLLTAPLILFGGIQMCRLRGYGLAIFGSILALLPCISPVGCCLVGQVAGVWALIVLASPDVRAAFR